MTSSIPAFFGGLPSSHQRTRHNSKAERHLLELLVVGATAGGVDQATGNTRDQEAIIHNELDDRVKFLLPRLEHAIELLGLRDSAGEAIEDEAG